MKKNCAIWFGIAQTRKCNKRKNENETNLQKNRLKDFEKLIDRREINSQIYDNFNWAQDMLWLFDLDEILAHDLLLRLLLASASNLEIALENNSSHIIGKNQQRNIKTNRKINENLYYDWFLRPPLAASIYFVDALEYVTNQQEIKETPNKSTLKALDLSLGERKRESAVFASGYVLCPQRVLDSVRMSSGEGAVFASGNVLCPQRVLDSVRKPSGEGAVFASGNVLCPQRVLESVQIGRAHV